MTESSRQEKPRLSIVVPVYNEARYLAQTLGSLAAQTARPHDFEVLIYDGGSTDETVSIANSWLDRLPNLKIADNPKRLPSSARNLGLDHAGSDVIAFVEGHCMLPPSFVNRAVELLDEKQADALGRPIDLVVPSDPPIQQAIGIARQSAVGHARSSLLYSKQEGFCSPVSCATLYRRHVFDKLGRFDEALYVAEDVEFNKRFESAGYRHYFSQELKCLYHPRRTYREFFRQMFNYGVGRTRAAVAHGRVAFSDCAPLAVCGTVIASLLALPLTSLAGIPAAGYLAVISGYSLWLVLSRRRPLLWPFVVIAIFIIHFGMAAGQVGGMLEWLWKK